MVGFGQIDELEVKAEGAGELVGRCEVLRVAVDAVEGLLQVGGGGGCVTVGVGLATGDGGAAEGLDGVVECSAGLLAEDFAEEHAEGTDVAAEGSFFELSGGGLEFGEALGPVCWGPEGRHPLIMPCVKGDRRVHRTAADLLVRAAGG